MRRIAVSIESTADAVDNITNPYTLRRGVECRYTIPVDFTLADLRKLTTHLTTLCSDWEPEQGWPVLTFPGKVSP